MPLSDMMPVHVSELNHCIFCKLCQFQVNTVENAVVSISENRNKCFDNDPRVRNYLLHSWNHESEGNNKAVNERSCCGTASGLY